MERIQYLIDTNVTIDYLGKKLPVAGMNLMNHIVDNLPIVSVITKIEVLGFKAPDPCRPQGRWLRQHPLGL